MPWISRVRALFRRKELAQELEEELRFHLSMREEWNVERGHAACGSSPCGSAALWQSESVARADERG